MVERGGVSKREKAKKLACQLPGGYKLLPVPCFWYIKYLDVLLSLLRPQQYSEEA